MWKLTATYLQNFREVSLLFTEIIFLKTQLILVSFHKALTKHSFTDTTQLHWQNAVKFHKMQLSTVILWQNGVNLDACGYDPMTKCSYRYFLECSINIFWHLSFKRYLSLRKIIVSLNILNVDIFIIGYISCNNRHNCIVSKYWSCRLIRFLWQKTVVCICW